MEPFIDNSLCLDVDYWNRMERAAVFSQDIANIPVGTKYGFYAALSRWASMPHIVNNRILGTELVSRKTVKNFLGIPLQIKDLDDINDHIHPLNSFPPSENLYSSDPSGGRYVFTRKFIAKNLQEFIGLEVWDFKKDVVTLYQPVVVLSDIHEEANNFIVLIGELHQKDNIFNAVIKLKTIGAKHLVRDSLEFYSSKVIPRISAWMVEEKVSSENINFDIPKSSLQLIEKCRYWSCYNSLKKYYDPISNIWAIVEESTNAEKMIHEDMGVAAYLMTIWQFSFLKDIAFSKFIDVGCGNGLLPLILTLSGFQGRGLDLRKRKMWNVLDEFSYTRSGCHLNLSETSLSPATTEFDRENQNTWLIGNHSDELTPWIPIWARQNNLNFFVLPCCPHDFSSKFQRKKGSTQLSIFSCYISYIKKIIESCGYKCYIDRLQIPSTKRICLVGLSQHGNGKSQEEIDEYIESVMKEHGDSFSVREPGQRVQNCTKLKSDEEGTGVARNMAKCVLDKLVTSENYIQLPGYLRKWNQGMAKLSLKDAVELLPQNHKDLLKRQGNGMQTLMKNHSQVFKVVNGFVCLRPPSANTGVSSSKSSRIKTKDCFLELYHPDGCPLSDNICLYKHTVVPKC